MNTTTMIDKLLAKATEYEHKAVGLRLAAEELQLELTQTKHAQLGQQLEAAVKVRRKQRPAKLREQLHATPDELAARLDFIRQALASGPKSTKDLTAMLQAEGARIGSDRVRQMIHEQMKGEVRRSGYAGKSVWALKTHRLTPKESTYAKKKRRQPDALDKARTVATILQAIGKPMPIKDLSRAAKDHGITGGLTGIANFVKQGYIKHNGKGYSFLAMPPEPTATA